jgi:hypothetical protein
LRLHRVERRQVAADDRRLVERDDVESELPQPVVHPVVAAARVADADPCRQGRVENTDA